ncbi:methyltransferase GidB [Coleofasciculus chthonoplastes PCC 7420]|uniref:Ribosomal RNA small subunit methyltransferase G n=1 Tax=Coleofasciculus chthonoplastes PCC 7420 TaxID=118168 RepID=B4W5E2_9CYAN|nr:methyltransferase GidB [Coleofasciculus chthonoplastes PCC 7420]
MLPEMVEVWQETLNWQPTESQHQQFQRLYAGILAGNRQLNLTRITQPDEFWEKHLWDSLRGVASLLSGEEKPLNIIDIGTGAGFPGLPVAIALPSSSVTLLDSTRKKITFLDSLIPQLAIPNATTVLGRAEKVGQQRQHHQRYDIALVRAVGSASACADYALPFVKSGGLGILYRGHWSEDQTDELKGKVESLGGAIASVESFTTPISHSIRHCLYLRVPIRLG